MSARCRCASRRLGCLSERTIDGKRGVPLHLDREEVVEAQNAVQQGRQEVKTKDGNDDAETEEEELAATSPIRLVTCRVPQT